MSVLSPSPLNRAAIRAEMRALHVGPTLPLPGLLIGLLAAASAASTFLTLSAL